MANTDDVAAAVVAKTGPTTSMQLRQLAEIEWAVSHAAANSALEGVDCDEDWLDVLRSVANGSQSASDAIQQEIERAKRQ